MLLLDCLWARICERIAVQAADIKFNRQRSYDPKDPWEILFVVFTYCTLLVFFSIISSNVSITPMTLLYCRFQSNTSGFPLTTHDQLPSPFPVPPEKSPDYVQAQTTSSSSHICQTTSIISVRRPCQQSTRARYLRKNLPRHRNLANRRWRRRRPRYKRGLLWNGLMLIRLSGKQSKKTTKGCMEEVEGFYSLVACY